MSLKDDIPVLLEQYKSVSGTLEHNGTLYNIHEGDLLTSLLKELEKQLSPKAYEQIVSRVAPINILKRLIDKLSKIYSKSPTRKLLLGDKDAGEKDQALLNWYQAQMNPNTRWTESNKFFNLFKTNAIEPVLHMGKPMMRTLPSDRFFVYSNDEVDPSRPTHFVKIMGKKKNLKGEEKLVFYAYTDSEFVPFDEDKKVLTDVLQRSNNPEGINVYGKIPAVYINRSRHDLVPRIDTDTLRMTLLLPILLSDLNFALMYQCFSIIYTIDVNTTSLPMNPNARWDLKSDDKTEKEPKVGVIKPEVDSDKALTTIKTQLSMWLQSRNIKPGAMGDLNTDNMASGVAKIIDEMDTSEDRQEQVPFYVDAEAEFANLIMYHMHPVWVNDPAFKQRGLFTPGLNLSVTFAEQRPILDSSKAIGDQKEKIGIKIQSRRGALQELYPDWNDDQITAKLKEVDDENAASAPVSPALPVQA